MLVCHDDVCVCVRVCNSLHHVYLLPYGVFCFPLFWLQYQMVLNADRPYISRKPIFSPSFSFKTGLHVQLFPLHSTTLRATQLKSVCSLQSLCKKGIPSLGQDEAWA